MPCGDLETVIVPETNCPLTTCDMQELQSVVLPLASSTEYGVDLYTRTLQFVSRKYSLLQPYIMIKAIG